MENFYYCSDSSGGEEEEEDVNFKEAMEMFNQEV
jgi:hypothetical protein